MNPVVYGSGVEIGKGVEFGHGVVLYGPCYIADGCRIGDYCIIHEGVMLGAQCQVQDGAVLGKANFQASGTGSGKIDTDEEKRLIIGQGSIIASGAILYWGARLGEDCIIADRAIVREKASLGDRVKIGKFSIVEYEAELADDVSVQGQVLIGERMTIGEGSFIGPHVSTACDKHMNAISREDLQPPHIGRQVRIGENSTLHPGVNIGDGSIVGAGSLIVEDIPPKVVVMAAPARVIKRVKP